MCGRPKGTTKTNTKKLKTFRLSAYELNIIDKTLKLLRNKHTSDISYNDFRCKNVYLCFKNTNLLGNKVVDTSALYTICGTPDFEYIAKCPVVSETSRSVNVISKSESGHFIRYKVNKCDIDKLVFFTTYDIALANYLYRYKGKIINDILALNNSEINNQFLILMSSNILNALEYGARILAMDYLFNVKDFTDYQ